MLHPATSPAPLTHKVGSKGGGVENDAFVILLVRAFTGIGRAKPAALRWREAAERRARRSGTGGAARPGRQQRRGRGRSFPATVHMPQEAVVHALSCMRTCTSTGVSCSRRDADWQHSSRDQPSSRRACLAPRAVEPSALASLVIGSVNVVKSEVGPAMAAAARSSGGGGRVGGVCWCRGVSRRRRVAVQRGGLGRECSELERENWKRRRTHMPLLGGGGFRGDGSSPRAGVERGRREICAWLASYTQIGGGSRKRSEEAGCKRWWCGATVAADEDRGSAAQGTTVQRAEATPPQPRGWYPYRKILQRNQPSPLPPADS